MTPKRQSALWAWSLGMALALLPGCGDDGGPQEPPPPAPPSLRLNEFMAANRATLADEFGEFDDWVELLNAGTEAASTAGFFLTDELSQPTRFALPDSVIAPGGVLLLWVDGQPEQGPWHAAFRLSAAGEELALFRIASSNAPALADSVTYGAQQPDTSMARVPGGDAWVLDATPTPGRAND